MPPRIPYSEAGMALKKVFLSLGSNLGNRRKNLTAALEGIERESIHITARSSIYETEPQDVTDQPWFLNMVVHCETHYLPVQLLAAVQRVEHTLGRVRTGRPRRGPRIIDIDILLFGTVALRNERLTIPHPRMLERRFVLEPLLEIAPTLRDPITGETLSKRLSLVQNQGLRKGGDSGVPPLS